jgi:hypothetical protein
VFLLFIVAELASVSNPFARNFIVFSADQISLQIIPPYKQVRLCGNKQPEFG